MRHMESIHDQVVEKLAAHRGRWSDIAKDSGVAYSTLKKIANRISRSPRVEHIEKLWRYFREREAA